MRKIWCNLSVGPVAAAAILTAGPVAAQSGCGPFGLLPCADEPAAAAPRVACGSDFAELGYQDGQSGRPARDLDAAAAACAAAGLPAPDVSGYETRFGAGAYVRRMTGGSSGRALALDARPADEPPTESAVADIETATIDETATIGASAAEAEAQAAADAEARARAEREATMAAAAREAARLAAEDAERLAAEEAERLALEEAERLALEDAERRAAAAAAAELAERRAAEAAARTEAERRAAEAIAAEEAERRAAQELARREAQEAQRAAEAAAREEADRLAAEILAAQQAEEEAARRTAEAAARAAAAAAAAAADAQPGDGSALVDAVAAQTCGAEGGCPDDAPEAAVETGSIAPADGGRAAPPTIIWRVDGDLSTLSDEALRPELTDAERRLLGVD